MLYFDLALGAGRAAQERINDLLTQAVQAHAYQEVAKIAALAERLAIALAPERDVTATITPKSSEPDAAAERTPVAGARNSSGVHDRHPSARRRMTRTAKGTLTKKAPKGPKELPEGYPRFEREADRLVKVGWSSRDQRGYEHRAAKSVIFSFVDRLRSHSGSPFAMDDVLPIKDESGSELPSYQAYLAVGWLRSVGAVRKVGKDGYSIDPALASPEALEKFWHSLPTR